MLFRILAAGFGGVVTLRHWAYQRGFLKTSSLSRPVISIGNLSTGGTGKTPFVEYLAKQLIACGHKPSILTRGYGRMAGPGLVSLPPVSGRTADPSVVGDEPALLTRDLPEVPIVICADRLRGGQYAEQEFGVDVHLLDDGFQHLRLRRDADIVLLDSMLDYRHQRLLPIGRLREPLSALRRADFAILTRTELGNSELLEDIIRSLHPGARVFKAGTRMAGLFDLASQSEVGENSVRALRAWMICGIGNPASFRQNLRSWGFNLVGESVFLDHHRYSVTEAANLAEAARRKGAEILLTTEKDAMNLPTAWHPPLPVIACRIELILHNDRKFLEQVWELIRNSRRVTDGST
jgi:tetraacyldisaccharide 4'-kinase